MRIRAAIHSSAAVAGDAPRLDLSADDVPAVDEAVVTAEEATVLEDGGIVLGEDALTVQEALVTVEEALSGDDPIVSIEPISETKPAPTTQDTAQETPHGAAPVPSRLVPPVVAIDTDLATLEWVKRALAETFPRVHIFQRSELGISRIRQYLARAEVPLVLLSADVPADPLSGAHNAAEMIRRLKAQASRMPIVLMVEAGAEQARDGGKAVRADAIAEKPNASHLADPRCAVLLTEYAAGLRDASVAASSERLAARSRSTPVGSLSPDALARLKQVSARMRDSGSRGEVLPQVIQFASEIFSRVAMFMIRDETAQGIAQVGLPKAGGPDEHSLREVTLPRQEPAWFRRVFDTRGPVRAAPSDDGDHRLAVLLGNAIPEEAYLAPIESGEHVVAVLYADNLPSDRPIGDTSALEVVLHEAGLALDRAWLERALEEAGG
jgi:DNA-binding NarL/FixJ family response regulator